jgi:hypothetical protein
MQIYAQIGALTVDNVMDLQLVYPSTSVVMTPKIGGYQVWADGFMRWDEVTVQQSGHPSRSCIFSRSRAVMLGSSN